MLRLPGEGDASAPLMAPLQKVIFAEGEPEASKRKKSKRKKKHQEAKAHDWDASSGKWRSSRTKGKRTIQTAAFWTIAVVVVVGAVFLFVKVADRENSEQNNVSEVPQNQFNSHVGAPLILPDELLSDPVELPVIMKRSEADFLSQAEPLAQKFLSTKRIEDLLTIVHDPKSVSQKIRSHYPEGRIEPVGILTFNSTGHVSYKKNFGAVSITTSAFEEKQMAFIEDGEGLKIDWESWVGWSEMPWGDLIKAKPEKPTLVRAMLKWVDYYNFEFSDERKWRSFRLISPDGEHMIYGYAARNSLLDQQIRPSEQDATVALTVKIHFPQDAKKDNQVIIDEYVADGWVVSSEKE